MIVQLYARWRARLWDPCPGSKLGEEYQTDHPLLRCQWCWGLEVIIGTRSIGAYRVICKLRGSLEPHVAWSHNGAAQRALRGGAPLGFVPPATKKAFSRQPTSTSLKPLDRMAISVGKRGSVPT